MKTIIRNSKCGNLILIFILAFLLIMFNNPSASAHCDSYDGPTIKDAIEALETNNVDLVLKWVSKEQEKEIVLLFNKTYKLKGGDKEIYAIVEKHFLETLVRLHRETEGAPFTGLKPAGSTKQIIVMSDKALIDKNIDDLLQKFNNHINAVLKNKFQKVVELEKSKNLSTEKGREYVQAYIDYTHTLEEIHDIIEKDSLHSSHKH